MRAGDLEAAMGDWPAELASGEPITLHDVARPCVGCGAPTLATYGQERLCCDCARARARKPLRRNIAVVLPEGARRRDRVLGHLTRIFDATTGEELLDVTSATIRHAVGEVSTVRLTFVVRPGAEPKPDEVAFLWVGKIPARVSDDLIRDSSVPMAGVVAEGLR